MNFEQRINLVIIDDIKSVVDGLTAIDWDACGITLAGASSNGAEGLELIKCSKPDIVISDIRMPRMDGLMMMQSLQELQLACKVILMTGYSDFDYAQKAVKLGAFDFILKPFSETEITQAVLRAKEQVLTERSEYLNQKEMERKLRESMPLLRQEYFSLLIHHRTSWSQAAKRWEFLKIELASCGFTVMLFKIDDFEKSISDLPIHEVELIRFSLQNIVEETIGKYSKCMVFRDGDHRFAAVLNASTLFTAEEIGERCCQNIERFTKFTVSVGIGEEVDEVHQLPDAYRQAETALAYHLFTDGNGAIGYGNLPKTDRQEPILLEHQKELLLVLRSGNGELAASLLSEMSGKLQSVVPQPNPDYSLSLYEELVASIIRMLYELVPQQEVQPLVDRFKAERAIAGTKLAVLEQQILKLCKGGAELVKSHSLSEGEEMIYKSLKFITSRLDRSLSVSECAAYVHLSPSYYSSLFKRVTGMTLTQYLAGERINKAKKLILDGMSVQDAALAVGYEDRRYFSETFKKLTGKTPSEFRESYESKSALSPESGQ